ncbi:MAG: alkaline phosphatase [Myxococcota bacterium]
MARPIWLGCLDGPPDPLWTGCEVSTLPSAPKLDAQDSTVSPGDTDISPTVADDTDTDTDTAGAEPEETMAPLVGPIEACSGRDDDGDNAVDEDCVAIGRGARNVILMVGDGMGFEQLQAARVFLGRPLAFDVLAIQGRVRTARYDGGLTDSASAATAMATGHRVAKGVISRAIPGDGGAIETVTELYRRMGRRTGLVTTHTGITDSTPAAFGADADHRNDQDALAEAYLTKSRPNVLMDRPGALHPFLAAQADYDVVQTEASLETVDLMGTSHLAGLFVDDSTPSLSTRAAAAFQLLDADIDGFFLLIETEQTGSAGHSNDLAGVLAGIVELEATYEVVRALVANRDDTLVVITADHETGGLELFWSQGGPDASRRGVAVFSTDVQTV